MQAIITGMNGTVAPVFAQYLKERGVSVLGWTRDSVPVDNEKLIRIVREENRPDWICHLATGSSEWAELIARVCEEYQIKLLYTSSVSVFSNEQTGPFEITTEPDPNDDYGKYKLECERRMSALNQSLIIARLGWQIGHSPGSNNMFDFLHRRNKEAGQISASVNWFPGCSFLQDTAEMLYHLMSDFGAGLYHLDANPGMSLYDIAQALSKKHQTNWKISPIEHPVINSLMKDKRIEMTSIKKRFEP